MNPLSTFTSPRERPPARLRPAGPEEIRAGVALLLRQDRRQPADEQVEGFLQHAVERGVDLGQLWLAEDGGQSLAAALPIIQPGRTLMLMASGGLGDPVRQAAIADLLGRLTPAYAERGVHLAQVLLDPKDRGLRDLLRPHGFIDLAELLYLSGPIPRVMSPQLPAGMRWQAYDELSHPIFAETILATYQGTLDCPGLNGLRDIEDVIAGHMAGVAFDPGCWLVLLHNQRPLAVLLMGSGPRHDALELTYLGVVPAARGRGLSRLLMQQALWMARQRGARQLPLTVDADNQPALRVYYRYGLRQVNSRQVMIRDFRRGVSSAAPASSAGS